MVMFRQPAVVLAVLLLALPLSAISSLSIGAVELSFNQVLGALIGSNTDSFDQQIIWDLRMPRMLLALFAGAGLSLAGLMLQTVTRNPLADPYLFGISSGAALGVVLTVSLSGTSYFYGANISLSIAAFVGSLVAMSLLLIVSGSALARQVESMLLAGVALSFLFSAMTSVSLYYSDPQAISAVIFWTMGSFARAQWHSLLMPAFFLVIVLSVVVIWRRQLTALLLGDESAITLGVNVRKFRFMMLALSSLLTASLVSVCGGIGFVGLMIPHIVRFLVSQASAVNPILVALLGGIFMLWVDVLARSLLTNQELPIGVITGLLGSLFFLSLMYWRRRQVRV
ncbi:FecCD family ABC transporter permease [Thalassotalea euphylliae]|uniref:FecCD family ABC transporter permease n=1 Tax=Thalassotalea euphylliae TaxID=1655234 RepID=UPI00363B719B